MNTDGWLTCHANSLPQINPAHQNEQVQTSQNNFFRQQPQPYSQPLQSPQFNAMTGTQPSGCYQGQSQCQPNSFSNTQQVPNVLGSNAYQQTSQMPCNSPQQNQIQGTLPPGILEQIRACMAPSAGPIFILPNNPTPLLQPSQSQPPSPDCPGIRVPCGQSQFCSPPQYYPYPMPMPVMSPFVLPSNSPKDPPNCPCCSKKSSDQSKQMSNQSESREHVCSNATDETICAKRNCPSGINLQALASQLLAVPGIISCAATRMILRKVPGSNITNSMEDIMDRSKKALNNLTQEQTLTESRNAQQVTALINLHMTVNPPPNIIPTLTTIQLKVNVLKNQVDTRLTRGLIECQGIGAEGNSEFDLMILGLKSDEELRQLLVTLKQKECDERVNLSFAPYRSQRIIAESRLRNVEKKIGQVEREIVKRRDAMIPRNSRYIDSNSGSGWHAYPGTLSTLGPFGRETTVKPQTYDSPDPFHIEVRSPRRLNLKPHVGSPETTYEREIEYSKEITFSRQNYTHDENQFSLSNSDGNSCFCGRKMTSDEDQNQHHENGEFSGNVSNEISTNDNLINLKKIITFAPSLSHASINSPETENLNEESEVNLCSSAVLNQDESQIYNAVDKPM